MNHYFDIGDRPAFTPAQCIRAMQADTFEGVLHFPRWDEDEDSSEYYVCKMNWTAFDAERAVAEYEQLRDKLERIAAGSADAADLREKSAAVAADPLLSEVWDTYIRPFETEGFDDAHILWIQEGLELPGDNGEDAPTAEDLEYYDRYCDAVYADCARRLTGSVCTYETVIRARRLCRLMTLHAPQVIVESEACKLAAAIALRAYCTEMEPVEA